MTTWDDGKYTKVKKVKITYDDDIKSVEFEYDTNGNSFQSPRRGYAIGKTPAEFTLKPDEYITDVTGYYNTKPNGKEVITALTFKTNQGTYGPYGVKTRSYFSINSPKGNQIVGFSGSSSDVLHTLDVHFGPIVTPGTGTGPGTSTGTGTGTGTEKVEAQGGKGGQEWDDGADHDGVKKMTIGLGRKGVHYVKFDYVKTGQLQGSPLHGSTTGALSPSSTFEITDPDEYLVSVVGYHENGIIQGLKFKTNKKDSQVFGFSDGTEFTLEVNGKKIVGFHGFADTTLNSLGAYFAPATPSVPSSATKLEAQGGKGDTTFDDGTFENVKKVYVGQGDSCISYVKFEYENGGKAEEREHGNKGMLGDEEFELEQDEYITSVEGYYEKIYGYDEPVISALTFKTSKGRSSLQFGISSGQQFELDGKGGKLVGFHGSVGEVLFSLGAYFAPSTTPLTPAGK